jgi:hypothetical protein
MKKCVLLALAVALGACGPPAAQQPTRTPVATPTGSALRYSFVAVDGRPVSTDAFRNRVTVIAFLTTYDVPSQVEARFLASLSKRHTPRLNTAALMLEAPENQPLVEAFAVSLGLPYPVAMADAATIAGEGPFAGMHHVPSVVLLDRQGRESYRHVGFLDEATLEAAVKLVEQRSPPPGPEGP